MQVGLRLARLRYEGQKVVELKYKDHCVGEGYPDLVVRLGRERIRARTFGVCEACKQPISKARLEAVPWTHLCTKCKEQRGA